MTRCECLQLSFAGLRSFARRHDIRNVEELSAATGCCTRCATCKPFVEEMLRTGRISPDEMIFEPAPDDAPDDRS